MSARASAADEHARWLARNEPDRDEREGMAAEAAAVERPPRLAALMVVADEDEIWIKRSVESVLVQAGGGVELWICDNGSRRRHVAESLARIASADRRVRVKTLGAPLGMTGALRAALSLGDADYAWVLEPGDELAPDAAFRVAEMVRRGDVDVVYTDEDRIDVTGERSEPTFKPYFSADLLQAEPYLGSWCVIRRRLLQDSLEALDRESGAGGEHALQLELSRSGARFRHLPAVLYQRRVPPGDVVPAPGGDAPATAEAEVAPEAPDPALAPTVSAIVLRAGGRPPPSVANSPLTIAGRPVEETIVAGSGSRPARDDVFDPSPARVANLAAERAAGEFLLFLDGRARLEVGAEGWLSRMLAFGSRPGVGAVGLRVVEPGPRKRFLGVGALVGHPPSHPPGAKGAGPAHRPPASRHPFNAWALTGECMLVRRTAFEGAGCFAAQDFPSGLYDVDLCLRLRRGGLANVLLGESAIVPGALLRPVPADEIALLWSRWWPELATVLHYESAPSRAPLYRLERDAALAT